MSRRRIKWLIGWIASFIAAICMVKSGFHWLAIVGFIAWRVALEVMLQKWEMEAAMREAKK